jgi:hypothetical protein
MGMSADLPTEHLREPVVSCDTAPLSPRQRAAVPYDPIFLDHAHLRSVRGDVETARYWYRRARDLGPQKPQSC